MSEEMTQDFEGGDAGASHVYPAQCSSLRKNGYVVIKVWKKFVFYSSCLSMV